MPRVEEAPEHSEEILDPQLAICDPHHHFWERPGSRYMKEELMADIGSGHRVTHTVFVECSSGYRATGPEALMPVGETEFVCRTAPATEFRKDGCEIAAGIVGFADLTLGDRVAETLAAHVEAGGGRFRGIRHASGWHPDPFVRNSHSNPPEGLLASAAFRAGFARLAAFNCSFDAWFYHPQIAELTDLARAFPETVIILDHYGGPLGIGPYAGRQEEVLASWRPAIAELASCPNVVVKIGGSLMKINGFDFHKRPQPPASEDLVSAVAPFFEHTLEHFGPRRCMFESNFPVDKVSCSYPVLWNLSKRLAAELSEVEKAALFRDNAMRVYRL